MLGGSSYPSIDEEEWAMSRNSGVLELDRSIVYQDMDVSIPNVIL